MKAWRLPLYHRDLHSRPSNPCLELPCLVSTQKFNKASDSASVSFSPGSGCQLPELVLHSLGHAAVSLPPAPEFLLLSVLSRNLHPSLSFSWGVLRAVSSNSINKDSLCIVHFESTAGHCNLWNPFLTSPAKVIPSAQVRALTMTFSKHQRETH